MTPPPSQDLIDLHFSSRVVGPCGTGSSGVMCIAEAPGRHEDHEGIVLHPKADAGSIFDRALRRSRIQRDTLTLSNTVWQRPPNNELADTPYLLEAKRYWMPHNEEVIQQLKPKVIVLLGNISLGAFTYGEFGYSDKTTILHLQGYTLWSEKFACYLLPCLHPSFILHGQQAHNQTLIWNLQRAFQLAQVGNTPVPTRYIPYPNESDLLAFERDFNPDIHFLSYDIETPESTKLDEAELEEQEDVSYDIQRMSLCFDGEGGYAISFPWAPPYIAIAMRIMAKAKRREVWNNYFDDPRLRAKGVILGGRLYDRMQSWRFLQPTLPATLEFASPLLGWTNPPWKSQSDTHPEHYSCVDAHALRRNGMAIEAALKARGIWERHERHVIEIYEVLTMMSGNGLPYCFLCEFCKGGGRCEEVGEEQCATGFGRKLQKLKAEREKELQTRVPDSIKPVKQKNGYKKLPKTFEGCVQRAFAIPYSEMTKIEEAAWLEKADPREVAIAHANPDDYKVQVERWALLKPFLPTSHTQMKKLIKWAGFKVGTSRKTKKETSDDEVKRKIIARCINSPRKKDQEFGTTMKMCREVAQLSKVLGTYVKGWKPGPDGRIHATPGFWGKMFRISWRDPNISGTIADKQEDFIAAGFRKNVKTDDDHILVEADWKGIEAVIVGYLADDPQYIRLAKMGVHDYFACHLLYDRGKIPHSRIPDLNLPDDDLRAAIKFVKKEFPKDRDDAKHTVHGSNYGMTAPLLSSLYELPIVQAEELLKLYFNLFPKIKAWQDRMKELAATKVWLENPFNYRMPFWEVHKWNSHRYEILAKVWDRQGKAGADGMPWKPNMRELGWLREIKAILQANPGMKVEDAISKLCWDLGDDAKSAISFMPRDTAAGMLRELLLRIRPLAEKGWLCGSAHDAVLCDVPKTHQSEVEELLYNEMTKPVPELGGLIVDVEVKSGSAWDSEGMVVTDIAKRLALKRTQETLASGALI